MVQKIIYDFCIQWFNQKSIVREWKLFELLGDKRSPRILLSSHSREKTSTSSFIAVSQTSTRSNRCHHNSFLTSWVATEVNLMFGWFSSEHLVWGVSVSHFFLIFLLLSDNQSVLVTVFKFKFKDIHYSPFTIYYSAPDRLRPLYSLVDFRWFSTSSLTISLLLWLKYTSCGERKKEKGELYDASVDCLLFVLHFSSSDDQELIELLSAPPKRCFLFVKSTSHRHIIIQSRQTDRL